jgi:acyl-CoA hydrolase
MNTSKKPSESLVIKTEMVLPNDTNTFNNLMGGRLMHHMDIVAAISAQRHCNNEVVTASVDNISFKKPIQLGDVLTMTAFVTRSFTSSMEVKIEVEAENIPNGTKFKSNEAYFTFVSINKEGKPQVVPNITPESEDEQVLYKSALRRRQLRLILGGKIKPEQADELKSLFYEH